jgi:RimJ/RimL family protein N-acetyltransferase
MRTLFQPEQAQFGDLVLRSWLPADAVMVMRAAADPLIALWNPFIPDLSVAGLDAAEAWCANRADWSDGRHASWAIAYSSHPAQAVGSVSLFEIEPDQARCQGGYWVAPEHRGRGVAWRGLKGAAQFAFDRMELHRVEIFHSVENEASCKTAVRAGLRLEGTHRQSHRYGDGRYHDEHCHAMLEIDAWLS